MKMVRAKDIKWVVLPSDTSDVLDTVGTMVVNSANSMALRRQVFAFSPNEPVERIRVRLWRLPDE